LPFYKFLSIKIIILFFLFSPTLSFSGTISEELRTATQLLTYGSVTSLEQAENASRVASIDEPKALLAHWLRAQSLYGLAGVGHEFDKKDIPFIEEAKVRIIPLPNNVVPGNVFTFPIANSKIKHILLMETSTSRLFVYKIDKLGNLLYENSFYSSIGLSGDNKTKEGDKKTPIGVYRFIKEISSPRADGFLGDLAMTLDYPNKKDKQDGRTGYGIWIHGVPKNTYVRSPKASDGCLALSNKDIQILKNYVTYKQTHILIVSKISWISPDEWKITSQLIQNLFSSNKKDANNNNDHKILTYFRLSKDRPSVALTQKGGLFYRDYWSETNKGLKKLLSERLN
jgi:L,D-peptidoglycan transpeptidase YkuD (ErfK/YbiS/YcfS/YnhG family)